MTTPEVLSLQSQITKSAAALVRDAIGLGEAVRLEFKSSFQKEVIETLAAFTNTKPIIASAARLSINTPVIANAVKQSMRSGLPRRCTPRNDRSSGVHRVIGTFVAYWLPEPVFEATQGGMTVTVFKNADLQALEIMDGAVNEGANGLSALITDLPDLRGPALSKLLGTAPKNVEPWLKQLKDQGKIEFKGASKTGGYYSTAQKKYKKTFSLRQ